MKNLHAHQQLDIVSERLLNEGHWAPSSIPSCVITCRGTRTIWQKLQSRTWRRRFRKKMWPQNRESNTIKVIQKHEWCQGTVKKADDTTDCKCLICWIVSLTNNNLWLNPIFHMACVFQSASNTHLLMEHCFTEATFTYSFKCTEFLHKHFYYVRKLLTDVEFNYFI